MTKYIIQKIASVVPVLIGISLIAFALGILSPGDPAEIALSHDGTYSPTPGQIQEMRIELGLDQAVYKQYLNWGTKVLHGDMGTSYRTNKPVGGELLRHLPVTLKLSAYAMAIACFFGISAGILSAAFRGSILDRCIKAITNMMLSIPGFWLAILLILGFSEKLRLLPTSGIGGFTYMIMPAFTLACPTTATVTRLTRSALLSEFGKQYYIAADAKGISRMRLILCNALPNAIIPIITLMGNYFGGIMGGSVVVENIFSLPGVGSFAVDAIYGRDYPAIQGYVLFAGITFVGVSLLVDLICFVINPKIRLGGESN